MPTLRARHTLTETAEIARAIDDAAMTWPELRDDRAALLRKLVETGHESITHSWNDRLAERQRALHDNAGALTGVYPPGTAAALKSEWPE